MVNDGELPQQYFPLALWAPAYNPGKCSGRSREFDVNVPPAADASPSAATSTTAAAAENAGSLTISGMVNQEITLTDADLRAMDIVTINATGKDGPQDFQGAPLNSILDKAGIKAGAAKLTFTASDNYTADVNLSDVRNCKNALLAFMDTPGTYMIVLQTSPPVPG